METEKKEAAQKSGWVEIEKERVRKRREALGLSSPEGAGNEPWGLALSGGGIRSATFALGVMQAMAKAKAPPPVAGEGVRPGDPAPTLLPRFDYLSTVSGGGYLGGFFTSLFVPNRLETKDTAAASSLLGEAMTAGKHALRKFKAALFRSQDKDPVADPSTSAASDQGKEAPAKDAAAIRAYEVMANDPPGRVRSSEKFDPLRKPLSWLRENGRYLMPTGAGDFVYAAGLALRNWCSVHYVIGTAVAAVFGLAIGLKAGAGWGIAWLNAHHWLGAETWLGADRTQAARSALESLPFGVPFVAQVWWSALWVLPLATVVLWLVPSGLAYWLVSPSRGIPGAVGKWRRMFSREMVTDTAVAIVLGYFAWTMPDAAGPLKWIFGAITFFTALAAAMNAWASAVSDDAVQQRVWLTRAFANGLLAAAAFAVLALIDTASQTLYLWLMLEESPVWKLASPAAAFGAVMWLVRKGATLSTEKKGPGWLEWVPLNLMAGLLAAVVLFTLATAWATLVHWVAWQGAPPEGDGMQAAQYANAWKFAAFAVGLAWLTGYFPRFINQSTLHEFYSTRLTRAYLGGSNGARFVGKDAWRWASAAEPHPKDGLSRADYFAERVHAPLHLINVTLNQTVDPTEQLVQRDRKGKLLVVGPAGYQIDGDPIDEKEANPEELTVGQWIGLSGAAVATGLGRTTSLGFSLMLGLANVRLGRWWQSGAGKNEAGLFGKFFLKFFRTQTYLFYEFTAHFHGTHRPWQYLSDGGHYENTAAYELLRPEREVSVVVMTDAGCDENYEFGDFANLIRLVRIDFQAEVERVADLSGALAEAGIFGATSTFRNDERTCALLYRVSYPASNDRWLLVLKPRVVRGVSADIVEYQREQPKFPQQSTADQFFDEAQWESYRKLGLEVGSLVFTTYGGELWSLLRERTGIVADATLRKPMPRWSAARPPQ